MSGLQQIERNLELAYGQYLNAKIQLVSEKEKTKQKMTKTEAADILDSIETQRLFGEQIQAITIAVDTLRKHVMLFQDA